MDLKSFVAETLSQIVEGVAAAQQRIAEGGSNARVNPGSVAQDSAEKHGPGRPVEFDVALVVAEESTEATSAKAAASVGFLSVVSARLAGSAEASAGGLQRAETVSRVKFSVMLAQPSHLTEYRTTVPRMSHGRVV